jgi:hypothetical protein
MPLDPGAGLGDDGTPGGGTVVAMPAIVVAAWMAPCQSVTVTVT